MILRFFAQLVAEQVRILNFEATASRSTSVLGDVVADDSSVWIME